LIVLLKFQDYSAQQRGGEGQESISESYSGQQYREVPIIHNYKLNIFEEKAMI